MFALRSIATAVRAVNPLMRTAPVCSGIATAVRRSLIWSRELEPDHTFTPHEDIIHRDTIYDLMESTKDAAKDPMRVREILANATEHALLQNVESHPQGGDEYVCGLSLEETATLLNIDSSDETLMQDLFDTAYAIKERIYGNRIVLFAPLYLSNYCANSCTYCGYRKQNSEMERSCLGLDEVVEQAKALQRQGHRRALLLTGEHPSYTFEDFLVALKTVSEVETHPHGKIRRINVEIPPLSVSDFRRLKELGCLGTFTVFQETYDAVEYPKFHPGNAPKSDFENRLQVMDRAMTAGIDDVGIGALFGLTDYRFEVMAMLEHANHLQDTYGAGPHTVSIPRIRPASCAPTSQDIPYPVSDDDFRKLVAVIRCAVPYTGMIMSTRENRMMRNTLLRLGVSQMSAGSRTAVGAYSEEDEGGQGEDESSGQFSLDDERCLDEIVADLMDDGFVPSWCTACYRCGRTGAEFMDIAKAGDIHEYCQPNALLTLKEFALDYASEETAAKAAALIDAQKGDVKQRSLEGKLEKMDEGERDFYF